MVATQSDSASSAYAFPLLIKQLWSAPLLRSPDQEIVYRDIHRFTYRELRQRVGCLASVLEGLGAGFGDTVAVMDWDSHRYLECFYAVPMMGAALMTVNVRLSPDQILYTLNHSGPEILVLNAEFRPIFEEIRDRLTSVKRCIWISDEGVAVPDDAAFAGEYEALLAQASPDYAFGDFDENARATTFYTTGTTGDPKGVFFSHRQLVLHTLAVMATCCSNADGQRMHRGDVYMPMTPMFHVHAWGVPYVALQLGIKQVYPGRYSPELLLELIAREGVTTSHCVPAILQMLLASPKSASVDLSRLKMTIGGSALPVGLARQARERGIDVYGGYGMSETCPTLCTTQLLPGFEPASEEDELEIRCKAGLPLPLVELRTVDENMRDVADGDAGEIVVRAPWLTQGYVRNPQASERLWEGGYLHTQDIGRIENGRLTITDRLKDVIKTGGEWVSSVQVEDLISRHGAVGEVAVFGVKDAQWGERPLALVVPRSGQQVDEAAIKAHLVGFVEQGIIPKYAVPTRVLIVEAIEKTSVGKLNKKVLRKRYADGGMS